MCDSDVLTCHYYDVMRYAVFSVTVLMILSRSLVAYHNLIEAYYVQFISHQRSMRVQSMRGALFNYNSCINISVIACTGL